MIPCSKCLYCKKELFDNDPIQKPDEGDYCICIYCGEAMVFDNNLKVSLIKGRIPKDVKFAQFSIKMAILSGANLEKIIKDELRKIN